MAKRSWMEMFRPTLVRQAVWMKLGGELAVPIDSTSTRQDTALDDWAPADAGTSLRRWEKKLRPAFGVEEIAPGRQVVARQAFMPADPSQVQLPQTPVNQGEASTGVFGPKGSPYMHDSHMVTPSQSDRSYAMNEDSSDHGNNLLNGETWARPICELSEREEKNSTPRHEITTHLPLGNIKSFSGY
ncbi:hypothetical protein PHMEG_00028901 [Phytophthora megakarya]|uniref:Eukaryotic/viral aspartic protease n=1 Tax=Phytophthora megakarya TaxID=4795 RepID=A0A225V6E7_9STRA|nr:hypothetical protein PHMEG_00028901 [Phytophthora megakarya]